MDRKTRNRLIATGLLLTMNVVEIAVQNRAKQIKDEQIEKLIAEVRSELGGSSSEVLTEDSFINVEPEGVKLEGQVINFGKSIVLDKYEDAIGKLNFRVTELEEVVFGQAVDSQELDEETAVNKTPVL